MLSIKMKKSESKHTMNAITGFDKQGIHKFAEVEYRSIEEQGAFSARGSL